MTEWEDEDGTFSLCEGLLNIWWNPKLSRREDFGVDPPRLLPEVTAWIASSPGAVFYATPMVGPPIWVFPSAEMRQRFKDDFLETEERMREIIDAGVAAKKAEEVRKWYEQGKPRDEEGRGYIDVMMTEFFGQPESEARLRRLLLLPDPETGEYKF